jgi:hypothetical protein
MDNYESFKKLNEAIQKQYGTIFQASSKMAEAYSANQRMLQDAIKPIIEITERLREITGGIRIPNTQLSQITELSKTMEKTLYPKLYDLQITSTYIQAANSIKLSIPEYFLKYNKDSSSIISITDKLKKQYLLLNNKKYEEAIFSDDVNLRIIKPSKEFVGHLKSIKDLGFYKDDETNALETISDGVINEDQASAADSIERKNKDWLILLDGAEKSVDSDNPDKIRHSITSLRELLTQIIHNLAPDDEIKRVYPEEKYYDHGKPTRRTRLLYIFKMYDDNELLVDFYQTDIDAILLLFDLFQKGTHEIRSRMSDNQLRFIVQRTKILFGYLLSLK